jgi:hypothetical protein
MITDPSEPYVASYLSKKPKVQAEAERNDGAQSHARHRSGSDPVPLLLFHVGSKIVDQNKAEQNRLTAKAHCTDLRKSTGNQADPANKSAPRAGLGFSGHFLVAERGISL